ncbi:hypothetical protein RDI58_017006 [Solanum bulbocastanum]|uniref:Uncharacterized protein n=1 Tax=Solanum bulbocastanum TaxID=147425 RepID=A0AAN8Y8Q5_SOLBU
MWESYWTRILARQPGWKYIRTGACSHGGDSSLSCRVVSITDLSLIVSFAESVSETIFGVKLHWVLLLLRLRVCPFKEKSLAQRRRMRIAESRGEHFKGLLLLFAIPVTLQPVLAALAVIPVSLVMFAGKRLYLYLGVATQMTGYPATGACSHGDDSSVSCRIVSITNLSLNV